MAIDRTPHTLAHALAQLVRLDLLIKREVVRLRAAPAREAGDEFRGLYISEADVDALLDGPLPEAETLANASSADSPIARLEASLSTADAKLARMETAAAARGEVLRLDTLSGLFELSSFERQVLVVALAAEFDLKYERLFGYLQDDVTKKRPTIDLVLRLLCPEPSDRLRARVAFESNAPLLRWKLVSLVEDPALRQPALLGRYVKLDERIASYLLGGDAVDSRLAPLLATVPPEHSALAIAVVEQVRCWAKSWDAMCAGLVGRSDDEDQISGMPVAAPVILFHGRYGTGRRAAATLLASSLARPLLLFDLSHGPSDPHELRQILALAEREALLTNALLGWYGIDRIMQAHDATGADATLLQGLARGRVPTVLIGEQAWEPARLLERRPFLRLELPDTTYAERRDRWAAGLNGTGTAIDDSALRALAARFRLTAGQIDDALVRARALAWTRDPSSGHITGADLDEACRVQARHRLEALAHKLMPRYGWEDIVLPVRELATLRMICSMVRQRPTVYGDWGFDRKLAMGKGVIALFAGPSGTGKTMAAEVIARDLGLELYRIDLSAIVNKYIGETEKNLERLFAEARNSDAILFFDEADALFGKRSSVSDAHDRYANIETAYLLQKTEEYDGLVILASNLSKNIDDAFMRRMHFSVSFREPDEPERLRIWRQAFPPDAPRGSDIDLELLARKFKVTGGNIRNIVLAAAFLAAEDGQRMEMRHLMGATAQEFQKIGRIWPGSELA